MIVLQVLGWILLGLLVLLMLLLVVPLHALVDYTDQGLSLRVRVLFITLRILPQKPARAGKEAEPEADVQDLPPSVASAEASQPMQNESPPITPESGQADVAVPQTASAEEVPDTAAAAPATAAEQPVAKKRKRKWTLDDLLALVSAAGSGLRIVFRDLRVTHIRLYLPVHAENADETARLYGQIHAYVGGAIAVLRNALHLDFQELCIEPDFCDLHAGQARFSCRITGCLLTMLLAGIHVLLRLRNDHVL